MYLPIKMDVNYENERMEPWKLKKKDIFYHNKDSISNLGYILEIYKSKAGRTGRISTLIIYFSLINGKKEEKVFKYNDILIYIKQKPVTYQLISHKLEKESLVLDLYNLEEVKRTKICLKQNKHNQLILESNLNLKFHYLNLVIFKFEDDYYLHSILEMNDGILQVKLNHPDLYICFY